MSEIYSRTAESDEPRNKNDLIYQMQDRLDRLEHDYENLMEQIRLANQQRYGRRTKSWTRSQDSCLFLMKRKPPVRRTVRNRP